MSPNFERNADYVARNKEILGKRKTESDKRFCARQQNLLKHFPHFWGAC
jgi:hypothetical protein